MRIIFKTPYRISPFRILFVLLLIFGSAYYHLRYNFNKPDASATAQASLIPIPSMTKPKAPSMPTRVTTQVAIAKNQTFSDLMKQNGFDNQTIQEVFESTRDVYNLNQIHAGKNVVLTSNTGNIFSGLEYAIDPTQTLVIRRDEAGIKSEIRKYDPERRVEQLGGVITGSLYATIDRLGGDDQLVMDFADIFEWDVDFFKDLQAGDTFRIVYEANYIQGQPLGNGKILAAQLTNRGRTYTALGFQSDQGWAYFSPDGKAMKKAFLAAPLKFSRISSGFTTSRYHPILHSYRAHYGIDYAAPYGTPVRAIGHGTVLSAGWAGGAGKMIKIQHSKEISTIYCHLSRFAPGIKNGASVSQGQVIGYVGATGLATGPHLDFRFLKNGKYVNFLTVKGMQSEPLAASEIQSFQQATISTAMQLLAVPLKDPFSDMAYVSPHAPRISEKTY